MTIDPSPVRNLFADKSDAGCLKAASLPYTNGNMNQPYNFDKYTDAMDHEFNRVTHVETGTFLLYLPGMTDEQAINLLKNSL